MSKAKCNLTCDTCKKHGRHVYLYKGKFICHQCTKNLPSTHIQDELIKLLELENLKNANRKKA